MEVDAKTLDVDQQVLVRHLPIPPGTRLVHQVKVCACFPCSDGQRVIVTQITLTVKEWLLLRLL